MANSQEQLIYGVVGQTGVGKSTLALQLAELYNLDFFPEIAEKNPYLPQFYRDVSGESVWSPVALLSQLHFLVTAWRQALEIKEQYFQRGVVWDVPPTGHRMYADILAQQGIMSPKDYGLYCRVYDYCRETSIEPDILLVVTTDIDTQLRRIEYRGRDFEQEIPVDYLERQIEYWGERLMAGDDQMVQVDSKEIDWRDTEGAERVWELVAQAIPGLGFEA
jgi:deoxyadenosine/deoxycytidine kinase